MAFYTWIDTATAGTNVLSESNFSSDTQRASGFTAGTLASSIRVNTALRQSTLVTKALMDALELSSYSYLDSDATMEAQVKTALQNLTLNTIKPNEVSSGVYPTLTSLTFGALRYLVPSGTSVVANPTLDGTESALTGLQVGSTKYKLLEEKTGSGNLVDEYGGSSTVGTYDYIQVGKLCTITLHIPNPITSIAMGLLLDGLDPVASGSQQFGYVQNELNVQSSNLVCVSFTRTADNKTYAGARVNGSGYASNFTYLDNATFTLRMG